MAMDFRALRFRRALQLRRRPRRRLAGSIVDDHTFCGVVPTAQLLHLTQDPRQTEVKTARAASASVAALYEIRREVQRQFEGEKKRNVEPYSDYMLQVHAGQRDGEVPTIIFWTESGLDYEVGEPPTGTIQIPYGMQLVAIDGETQLAGRYLAGDKNPNFMSAPVSIKICHGRSVDWAKQVFHDLNTLGVKPNVAKTISMDLRDPLTNVARAVEKEVAFFSGRVNEDRRSLRKSDREVFTVAALRAACVMLSEGIGGTKYGSRPVEIEPARVPTVREVAIEWFRAVTLAFGGQMEDREGSVMTSPTVLAAVGAVGHELLNYADDANGRRTKQEELLGRLGQVDWTKGEAWVGVIGSFNAKGKFSIQGTGSRGTIAAAFRALNDPNSAEGLKVRRSAAA
jgi:DNA-sulfur modification-associated